MMARDIDDAEVVVLDTATTGLGVQDQVVEIAMVRVSKGVVTDRFTTLVRPSIPIPATASEVHHIVDADVSDAPWLAEIADAIVQWVGDDTTIVAIWCLATGSNGFGAWMAGGFVGCGLMLVGTVLLGRVKGMIGELQCEALEGRV